MARNFILYYSATQIRDTWPELAEAWLEKAADYVVTLKAWKFRRCFASADKGFREGWKLLADAGLASKGIEEYLGAAKTSGGLFEAIPRAV